ncbi:zinc finger protein 883-like [Tigriopus californicus]|uniref:zinc finger protein 883-like n=1 Tax=Tigriopus californicus TaxID=6832 RepID=UPI0027D9E6F7|nr:zinc finger protein 883-like [Tigriopus californicus]
MFGSRLESNWERVEHALHLRDMCFNAFKSEDLCDLTLTSLPTNQSFLTHKVVIAAFSELWRSNISGTDILKIEASPEEVKTLLKYMYTGFIDVNDSSSWEGFQRLVDQYQIYLSLKVQKKFSRLYRTEKTCPWFCATCGRNWSRPDHAVAHAKNVGHHQVKCSKCHRAVPLLDDLESSTNPSMSSHLCYCDLGQRLQPQGGEGDPNEVDEDNGEDEDWGSPTASMIMPELILQEEDPEVEEEDDDDDEDGEGEHEEDHEDGNGEDREEHDEPEERRNRKEQTLKQPILLKNMKSKTNDRTTGFSYPPSSRKEQEQIRNKKKYLCSLCGSTLTGKTAYNRHQLIHTGKRPFSCDICGKSFTQNMRLTVHSRSHTGERPFLCSLCGKTFVESCKLNRHLQRVHMANKDGNPLIPGQPVINTEKFIMPISSHLKRQQNVITGNKKGLKPNVIK